MSGACGDCGQTVVRGEDAEQAVVAAAWSNHRRYCRKPRTLPTRQQLEGCQTCATTHLMVDLHKWSAAAIAKANGMGVPRLKKHLYRGKPAPAADSATVRAWAKEHGVDCPASGVVPARVRDAYETAVAS